ncbi:MAG: methyl-accepting chemotaxis protein [Planctomycetaceae bacterium]
MARAIATRRPIARRLLLWFLVIALVPCGILTVITTRLLENSVERSVRQSLSLVADAKTIELEAFAAERVRDGTALARAPEILRAVVELESFADDPARLREAAARVAPFLGYVANAFGYAQVLLVSLDGHVLFSLDETIATGTSMAHRMMDGTELEAGFDRTRTLLQSDLGAFQNYQWGPMAFVTSPILDEGRVRGVLALGLSPEPVWQMLSTYAGFGETSEIVTASLREDIGRESPGTSAVELLVTSPLRYRSNAAFTAVLDDRSGADGGVREGATGTHGFGLISDYRGKQVVAAWRYLPSYRWGLEVKQDADEAYRIGWLQRAAITTIAALTLVGVAAAALIVARSISKPITRAVEAARQVASGDLRGAGSTGSVGDTPPTDQEPTGERVLEDETEALSEAIRVMTGDLRGLIGRIQRSSVSLVSAATAIQAASRDQEGLVADLGASTSEAVAAVRQIAATSQDLLTTMDDVNRMAAEAGAMATKGRAGLTGMGASMRQLTASTGLVNTKLSVISDRADAINLAVTTITKVADQTNLLSINAAIEAEKAGEYGLGFLVVAREIRRLADQTAIASLDIERIVKEMQLGVSAGVMEMDRFSERVREGVREIADVSENLSGIIEGVHGISGRFAQVTEGMRMQAQGADQIREAMGRLSDGAGRTSASLGDLGTAASQLRAAVGGLKEEVSRFTT